MLAGGYDVKNYLFDLYPDFPKDFALSDRKDPESDSRDLYLDFKTIFFNVKHNCFWHLLLALFAVTFLSEYYF